MKRIYPSSVLLFLILFVASCNKSSVKPDLGQGINLALNAAEQQNATADNAFTFNLFKTVQAGNSDGSNLFLSPLSVSIALGMVNNGANGATLGAINNTLGFTSFSQDEVNGYFNKLITDLPKLDPNTTLNIANSIWYRQGFSILPQFLKTDSSYFHANIQSLDFSNSSSVNTINNWVNTQTHGKIPTIIDQIPPGDVMYLINAIYFKSIWDSKFDQGLTQNQAFHLPDQSTVQASFMKGKVNYNFHYVESGTVIELPYINKKFSMVIVMPNSTTSLGSLVAGLDTASWNNWVGGLTPNNAEIIMPKFKFGYSILLNNDLIKLGMGNAFSLLADFTRINAGGGLNISKVQHKAFVAVDETGTQAAAATSVSIQATDVLNPPSITIDHPFLFVIREMKTGLILFAGIMNNPLQQ
jgi:serpin B